MFTDRQDESSLQLLMKLVNDNLELPIDILRCLIFKSEDDQAR